MQKLKKSAFLGALLGTVTEYYDYSLYGFLSLFIARNFFPQEDLLNSLVITFGVFAIGYVAKPLGSLIFGYIGDNYGRKVSLQITILGIAIPTFLIGVLPGFQSLGILSSVIVIFCRFSQGFFVGGEHDGASIYLMEHLGEKRSGFVSALVRFSSVMGILLAALTAYLCPLIHEDSWRLAFLLSLPLSVLTLSLRKNWVETPEFLAKKNQPKERYSIDSWKEILCDKHQLLLVLMAIVLFGSSSGSCQLIIIFFKSFLATQYPTQIHLINFMTIVCIVGLGFSMLSTAFLTKQLDKRKLALGALLSAVLFAFGLVQCLYFDFLPGVFACLLGLSITLAPTPALAHSFMFKAFPVERRYRCTSMAHAIGSMTISGSAPFFAMSCYKIVKYNFMPGLYLLLLILSSLSCLLYLTHLLNKQLMLATAA